MKKKTCIWLLATSIIGNIGYSADSDNIATIDKIESSKEIDAGYRNDSNNTRGNNATKITQKVEKAKKGDEIYKDMFTKAKLKGFVFGRFLSINGANGEGYAQQYRMKLDVTTGAVYGYSLTTGLFFSQGSSAIDSGRTTDGDVQGARATADSNNFADRFNISQIYMSKTFSLYSNTLSGVVDVGKMNINSLLTNKTLDLGLGGHANLVQKLDIGNISYDIKFFDSFNTDHASYNIRRRGLNGTTTSNNGTYTNATLTNREAASVGIGNNLTILHVKADLYNDLVVNALYANIYGLFDYIIFADASYRLNVINDSYLTFLVQIATAGMNDNPNLDIGTKGTAVTSNFGYEFANLSAKTRGVYNLQVKYKYGGLSAKFGFLGSFADGYGVLLAHKSGIDTAGKIWNGNFTATYEGLGFLGSGGFKGTSIGVLYLSANYNFGIPLKVSLDISYLFGNNNFPLLNVTNTSATITNRSASNGGSIVGGKTNFINAQFVEIAPSVSYKLFKYLEASLLVGVFAGDINFVKTQTELRWTF